MLLITGEVAHYPWGSSDFLPEFLSVPPDGRPWAEYWIGTHPAHPSRTDDGRPLTEVTGTLPFLVKVLSAGEPLSIQAHPDAAQAAAGYDSEEAAGIPRDAADRNYRDAQGKPELLWALTTVEALCGFRDPERTGELLNELAVPELDPLAALLRRCGTDDPDGLRESLRWALLAAPPDVAGKLATAASAVPDDSPWRAEADWLHRLGRRHPGDRGVVAASLLNLVRLEPGSALALRPGVLHAYLAGSGVEVMGASDNVLRGGLTDKHVDVPELLRVLQPGADSAVVTPVPEQAGVESLDVHDAFRVRVARPHGSGLTLPAQGATLALCVAGAVRVDSVVIPKGRAGFATADGELQVAGSGTVVVVSSP